MPRKRTRVLSSSPGPGERAHRMCPRRPCSPRPPHDGCWDSRRASRFSASRAAWLQPLRQATAAPNRPAAAWSPRRRQSRTSRASHREQSAASSRPMPCKHLLSHIETYFRIRLSRGIAARACCDPLGFPRSLKIRSDAFALPIAIPGRFRTLRSLELLLMRRGAGLGGLSAGIGLGERALGGGRQLLAFRGWRGRSGLSVIAVLLLAQGSAYRSHHNREIVCRDSYIWHIRMPNRL